MNKYIFIVIFTLLTSSVSIADEGMWIPMLLKGKTESDMQKLGSRLTAEDIYSINKNSLKDAILQFGGGCTAEFVSKTGLILTNHHCGFSNIQSHSSLEHDYLREGFWATTYEDELPNKGLTAEHLIRMDEVTEMVMTNVSTKMTEKKRDSVIQANIAKIVKEVVKGTHYEAKIRAFYGGNAYYLFVTETFKDVRLVGAPPTSIGNFGGDTDNWVWPRHTGDFSVFRVYVNKDGKPAEYSKDNVPYEPKSHLSISLKGYTPGDFTLIYGYPGRTQEYLPAAGIQLITENENPVRIELRSKRLEVIKAHMNSDRGVRIQYAAKAATIANGWKKWQGENRGINRLNTVAKKKELEMEFQTWAFTTTARREKYGKLLEAFKSTYDALLPLNTALIYYQEAGMGIELVRYAGRFSKLYDLSKSKNPDKAEIEKVAKGILDGLAGFYKDYQLSVDREIAPFLLREYAANIGDAFRPDALDKLYKNGKFNREPADFVREIFDKTLFAEERKVKELLEGYKASDYKILQKDPLFSLAMSITEAGRKVQPGLIVYRARLDSLQRIYMQGLMEMMPAKNFYPDANSTLRIAYGKVDGYKPNDAVKFNYFTTLDGVIQKEDSTIYDYRVEPKVKSLYSKKDYGPYADKDGSLHTCFIANMHTSGGNSGSPVLNAGGQLIGINFDRCWEGTMSDLAYDPDQCRNITLDIRYCLWVMDKVAGAGNLVREMSLVP